MSPCDGQKQALQGLPTLFAEGIKLIQLPYGAFMMF